METIVYSSLKGGVGKTTDAILTAANLAARGYKVLFWDSDTNNSGTVTLSPKIENLAEIIEKKNIFEALSHNNVLAYAIESRVKNISLVPSHLNIFKLRGIGYYELQKTLKTCADEYDYCVIDTAPTYDNLVINALMAASLIITPARLTPYDFSTASFIQRQLYDDCPSQVDKWYIMFSFWEKRWETIESAAQTEWAKRFAARFSNILKVKIMMTKAAADYTQLDGYKIGAGGVTAGARSLAAEFNELVSMFAGSENEPSQF